MKIYQLKFVVIFIFAFAVLLITLFGKNLVMGKDGDDVSATYKKNCAACHTAKAEKFFDPTKSDNDYIQAILKGKKGEKPPFMPAFEEKNITADQAKELAVYMRRLRICNCDPNSNTSNTNVTASNTTTNANLVSSSNAAESSNSVSTNTVVKPVISDETIAFYKKTCQACHTPKAEKFFDNSKTDATLEESVLNGKKGEKPPFMPEFKSKGVTSEQAKNLVSYMRSLKTETK